MYASETHGPKNFVAVSNSTHGLSRINSPLVFGCMRVPVAASTLQFVDRYCGIPVCAVLSWTNQVAKLTGAGRRASARPEKILFVKFAEQGSTVLARSAIQRALDLV